MCPRHGLVDHLSRLRSSSLLPLKDNGTPSPGVEAHDCNAILGDDDAVIAGRMSEQPLADGLIAHIALKRSNGIEVINVWESLEQSQAAFERPEFQAALREAGLSPSDIQPEDIEVMNVRTS